MEREVLYQLARAAREAAYAPYSRYAVGAVVVTRDGRAFRGANVENASLGLTVCAERAALLHAVAEGAAAQGRDFAATVAVLASGPGYAAPCGACRQMIREFASAETRVVCFAEDGSYREYAMAELLPEAFGPEALGK